MKWLEEKWSNFRILSHYTQSQHNRLEKIRQLYAQHIKEAVDPWQALENTYLAIDPESHLPVHEVNTTFWNPFDRLLDKHPLSSYINMAKAKVITYMVERLDRIATYKNDPNSLLCWQILVDIKETFANTVIQQPLLDAIERWLCLLEALRVAKLAGTHERLFSASEEYELKHGMLWLLPNLKNIFSQMKNEILIELSRRTLSDHLDDLAHNTKLTIEIGFEYLAHLLTHPTLSRDFTLASFYDERIDRKWFKMQAKKPWLLALFRLANSQSVSALFFQGNTPRLDFSMIETPEDALMDLLRVKSRSGKHSLTPSNPDLLMLSGKLSIKKSLVKEYVNETGLAPYFVDPHHTIYVLRALEGLNQLETLAELSTLLRMASYLLHQDSGLLIKQEARDQLKLFISLYQHLNDTFLSILNDLEMTHEGQQTLSERQDDFYRNVNLEAALAFSRQLDQLQTENQRISEDIQYYLNHRHERRQHLNQMVELFKQACFDFMQSHLSLLDAQQKQTFALLHQQARLDEHCLIEVAVIDKKQNPLLVTPNSLIPPEAFKAVLASMCQYAAQPQPIEFIESYMLVDAPDTLLRIDSRAHSLKENERLFCILGNGEQGMPVLVTFWKEESAQIHALFIAPLGFDQCSYSLEAQRSVKSYCVANQILFTAVSAFLEDPTQASIVIYRLVELLIDTSFLFQKIEDWKALVDKKGLTHPNLWPFFRYNFTRHLQYEERKKSIKRYSSIQVSDTLMAALNHPCRLDKLIDREVIDALFRDFPKSHFPELRVQLDLNIFWDPESLVGFTQNHGSRFEMAIGEKIIALGRKWKRPLPIAESCIRHGIENECLWKALMVALKQPLEAGEDASLLLDVPLQPEGHSLLHYAVSYGRLAIIEELLQSGMDIHKKDDQGQTALDLAFIHYRQQIEAEPEKEKYASIICRLRDAGMTHSAIQVISLDFDGCLYEEGALGMHTLTISDEAIEAFIQQIFTCIPEIAPEKTDKLQLFCGSNRQANAIDQRNCFRYNTISYFPVLQRIADQLGCQLNPILLEDIYRNVSDGSSFLKGVEANFSASNPFSEDDIDEEESAMATAICFERNKLLLLYLQTQSVAHACQQGSQRIDFHFIDDKAQILDGVLRFFDPEMIPSQVALHLHQRTPSSYRYYRTTYGNGSVNQHYREAIKTLMGQEAKQYGLKKPYETLESDLRAVHHNSEHFHLQAPANEREQKGKKTLFSRVFGF